MANTQANITPAQSRLLANVDWHTPIETEDGFGFTATDFVADPQYGLTVEETQPAIDGLVSLGFVEARGSYYHITKDTLYSLPI